MGASFVCRSPRRGSLTPAAQWYKAQVWAMHREPVVEWEEEETPKARKAAPPCAVRRVTQPEGCPDCGRIGPMPCPCQAGGGRTVKGTPLTERERTTLSYDMAEFYAYQS